MKKFYKRFHREKSLNPISLYKICLNLYKQHEQSLALKHQYDVDYDKLYKKCMWLVKTLMDEKCIHYKSLESWLENKIYKPEEVEASLKVTFNISNLTNLLNNDSDEEDKDSPQLNSNSQVSTNCTSSIGPTIVKKPRPKKKVMKIDTKFKLISEAGIELYTKIVAKLLSNKVERSLNPNCQDLNLFKTEIKKEHKSFEHFIAQMKKASIATPEEKELLRYDTKISHLWIRIFEKLNIINFDEDTGKVWEYIDKVSDLKQRFRNTSSSIIDEIKHAIISLWAD